MKKNSKVLILIALTAIFALLLIFVCGEQIQKIVYADDNTEEVEETTQPQDNDRVIYYAEDETTKDYNFGPDAYAAAQAAVEAGEADSIIDYLFKSDGEGDFFTRIYHDPALCAAAALELDLKGATGDNPILYAEQDLLVGERADAAHLRFLQNYDQWDDAIVRIKAILLAQDNTWEVKEIDDYTSAMYMIVDQLEGDKPSVVVRNTTNAGGHFLVVYVHMGDGSIIEVRFRLECGYQPVDPNWPVPVGPEPVPDNPEPTPKKPVIPPEIESKDKKDGMEESTDANDPSNEWNSKNPQNQEPDTTPTDEPESPDSYISPEVPTTEQPTTEATTEKPAEEQPEASKNTDSGSKTVDEDNGKNTTSKDGKDAEVTAGDGEDRDDFGDVVDKDPAETQDQFKDGATDGVPSNVE